MPQLKFIAQSPLHAKAEAIGILVRDDYRLTASGRELDARLKGEITGALKSESFRIKSRNVLTYYSVNGTASKILCTAISAKEPGPADLREAAYSCVRRAMKHSVRKLVLAFDPRNAEEAQAIGEGALLAAYKYDTHKSEKDSAPEIASIVICAKSESLETADRAEAFYRATELVKNLVTDPPGLLRPVRLAQLARQTATKSGLECRVYEAPELEKMGMLSFLSVGKGSPIPSRMVQITYTPNGKAKAHVALIGKGITFDSGGLSLKPEKAMEHMKSDMTGAAIVLACVRAAKELAIPTKVTALMMITENMPDGGANRPGDVIRAMNGKTIEITNTDAEGRLALADGLTFAQQLNPDFLIDIATLTGAQVVSLGRLMGALMSNDDKLAKRIVSAGAKAGEDFWTLPLYEPYRELIKSDIADIRNASGILEAPSIQAALFLSEFVTHKHWAHLDIAGPSWQERDWGLHTRNASGFGARCLLTFLSEL